MILEFNTKNYFVCNTCHAVETYIGHILFTIEICIIGVKFLFIFISFNQLAKVISSL